MAQAEPGAKLLLYYGGTGTATVALSSYSAVGQVTSADYSFNVDEIDVTPIGQSGTALYQEIITGVGRGSITCELALDATTGVHSTLEQNVHTRAFCWLMVAHPQTTAKNIAIRGPLLNYAVSGDGGATKLTGTLTMGSSGAIIRNVA